MDIKNRITLGIMDGKLVAQVDAPVGAGPVFEHARPWLVLDIPLPKQGYENDQGQFAEAVGEVVAAQLLAEAQVDEQAPKKKEILSNQDVFDAVREWDETWPESKLTTLPGVGPSRAAKLVKKMAEENIIVQTTTDDAKEKLYVVQK